MTDDLKRKVCETVHPGDTHEGAKWYDAQGLDLSRESAICDRVAAMMESATRCQHQAPDASLDCNSPAVLCEHHGGHDACAYDALVAESERKWSDPFVDEWVRWFGRS